MYECDGQMDIFDCFNIEETEKPLIEIIKENEICKGSGFFGGKDRIKAYFSENHNITDEAQFLKKEYGIGGWSLIHNHENIGYNNHDATGITLEFNKNEYGLKTVFMQWIMVAKYIRELIKENRY